MLRLALRRTCLAPSQRFASALAGLKSEVAPKQIDPAGIVLTDAAVERIHEQNQRDSENPVLRLSVVPGGCQGAMYDFDWIKKPNDEDRVFEKSGATLVVDEQTLEQVKGSEIDFKYEIKANSFQVLRPGDANYTTCSCGSSFALE
ncbi:Iron-sulfur cluster insertion protein ErpA [Diplonema papillatum]|nr:Iron-sulfur cluster insertion protein ErpA [Diplonema papillatum]|eukprot:gene2906-4561_t